VNARFAASSSPSKPAHRVARPTMSSTATTVSPMPCTTPNRNQLGATTLSRNWCRPGMGLASAVPLMTPFIQSTPFHFWLAKYSQKRPTVIRSRLGQYLPISFMVVGDHDEKVECRIGGQGDCGRIGSQLLDA